MENLEKLRKLSENLRTLFKLVRSVSTSLKKLERQVELGNSSANFSSVIQDVKSIEKLIIRMISTWG